MSDTATETHEEYEARMARTREAMEAGGYKGPEASPAEDEGVYVDYFGFEETERVYLDGKQYVEVKALNEGGRRAYLNAVNREARISKGTGDTVIKLANGDERNILIRAALSNWNLMRPNPKQPGSFMPVPFNEKNVRDFLDKVNPVILDKVDKAVRKQNPWLMQDVTLEDLLTQRDELDEAIEKKKQEEEGKES